MADQSEVPEPGTRPRLEYPFEGVPSAGEAWSVAPGVLWIRMRLPMVLNHINLWALEDEGGWTIVDTGTNQPDTLEAWTQIFQRAMGGRPVKRVIVTHMHPDHIGLSGWICDQFNCPLWMTRSEYLSARVRINDSGRAAPADVLRFFQRAGWGEDAQAFFQARLGSFARHIHSVPTHFRQIHDGERIRIGARDWTVVVGTGHSPEHACLWSEADGLLISGDQVLPRISSNVSVYPIEPDADPLRDWFDSIQKIRGKIPADVLVLPAHNEPFRGLHARLDHLQHGHDVALKRLRRTLSAPKRANEVFGALFARPISAEDRNLAAMATGEALAHLHWLVNQGLAQMSVDAEQVRWFSSSNSG